MRLFAIKGSFENKVFSCATGTANRREREPAVVIL